MASQNSYLSYLFAAVLSIWSLSTSAAISDRVAPTTLRFLANSTQSSDGLVLAGESLRIDYDPIRLNHCRGKNQEGLEDWTVQAYLAIDGQAPLMLDLIQGRGTLFPHAVPQNVIMPYGHKLEIWFKASDVQGCEQWDSLDSKNYVFPIVHLQDIPTISFTDTWQVEITGELKAGQPLRIHYDLDRVTQCLTGGYHGSASWDVSPKLRVDGQPVTAQTLTYTKSWSERGQQDIVVRLPEGRELTLWFENGGYEYYAGKYCLAYDSNYGANYRFPLN